MYGYRDHCVRASRPNPPFYCPYATQQLQCPYFNNYRQRVEEFPIRQQEPPTNPPPAYTPKLSDTAQPNLSNVVFEAISPCIFRMTYLWLRNGTSFWAYLVFINRTTSSGWRYQNGRWLSFSADLADILNYVCS